MSDLYDQETMLFDWLTACEKENIILCFKGDFDQDLVNAIVMLTEQERDVKNSSTVVRTRVFSTMVECMQNIRKYGAVSITGSDLKPGILIVCFKDGNYTVNAGNFVTTDEANALKERLDNLKTLPKEELKTLHKKVLTETNLTDKSGAGLGLISIARKADELNYQFRPVVNDMKFYSLQVNISNR